MPRLSAVRRNDNDMIAIFPEGAAGMPRPSFNTAWSASQAIYDPADPAGKVAQIVGGNVAPAIGRFPEADRHHPGSNDA
jgi:hypothetical protein